MALLLTEAGYRQHVTVERIVLSNNYRSCLAKFRVLVLVYKVLYISGPGDLKYNLTPYIPSWTSLYFSSSAISFLTWGNQNYTLSKWLIALPLQPSASPTPQPHFFLELLQSSNLHIWNAQSQVFVGWLKGSILWLSITVLNTIHTPSLSKQWQSSFHCT